MNVGWTYLRAGRPDEALDQAGKMIEIEPAFYGGYWLKGAIGWPRAGMRRRSRNCSARYRSGGTMLSCTSGRPTAWRREGKTRRQFWISSSRAPPPVRAGHLHGARVPPPRRQEKRDRMVRGAFDERNGEIVLLQGEIAGAAEDDPLNRLGSDPQNEESVRRMNLPQ